jgi:hypothetical protein
MINKEEKKMCDMPDSSDCSWYRLCGSCGSTDQYLRSSKRPDHELEVRKESTGQITHDNMRTEEKHR